MTNAAVCDWPSALLSSPCLQGNVNGILFLNTQSCSRLCLFTWSSVFLQRSSAWTPGKQFIFQKPLQGSGSLKPPLLASLNSLISISLASFHKYLRQLSGKLSLYYFSNVYKHESSHKFHGIIII